MQEQPSYATQRRVGCIMWLAILALILSATNLGWNVLQELAWNERIEQATIVSTIVTPTVEIQEMPTEQATIASLVIVPPESATVIPTERPAATVAVIPTATSAPIQPTDTPVSTSLPIRSYSGGEIISAFQAAGIPLSDIVALTAETDPNNLLGRPFQYIEKISWKDARITTEGEPGIDTGGTLEIFLTSEDMQARKDYIESISRSASFLTEYSYSKGVILVRVAGDLLPEQAQSYENVLNGLP